MQGRSLLAAAVTVAVLACAPTAGALPGDATFAPTAPADGTEQVVDSDGIPVAFTCPTYRIADSGFIPLYGGPKDYGVSFARTPTLGLDGRLAEPVALGVGATPAGAPEGSCVSGMAPGGARPLPQETPGTYYWQVWRICTDCPTSYEAGPVLRFVLRAQADLAVGSPAPARAFVGYPIAFPLTLTGLPDGTTVHLQRRTATGWKRVGAATALGERGEAIVILPKGTQRLRLSAVLGTETVISSERQVPVRAARNWSTGEDDAGRYAGKAGSRSVKLTVTATGRELRQFSASVAMLCPGLTGGTFTTQIGTAAISKVRLDPDGRFLAALTPNRQTAVRVRGRVRNGKVVEGRVELSVGTCSGSTRFAAQLAS